jgi:hypothetical protein
MALHKTFKEVDGEKFAPQFGVFFFFSRLCQSGAMNNLRSAQSQKGKRKIIGRQIR